PAFTAMTVAPGTEAPEGSMMRPLRTPYTFCAKPMLPRSNTATSAFSGMDDFRFIVPSCISGRYTKSTVAPCSATSPKEFLSKYLHPVLLTTLAGVPDGGHDLALFE